MAGRNSGNGVFKGFFLLCIGCVLIAVGLSFGGRFNGVNWWPWQWHQNGFKFEWNDGKSGGDAIIRDIETLEGQLPSDLDTLDIRLKAASLVIRSGADSGYVATDFEKDAIRIRADGKRFSVEESDWQNSLRFGTEQARPVLEIVLPEGLDLAECRISVGAGSVRLEGIKADSLRIDSGAGSIKGDGLAAQKTVLKTGAGSLEFTDCAFDDTGIETGAGRVVFEGDMTSRMEISTGAGSVRLDVGGTENDYRVDFNRGIGSVRIGSESYNGVGNGTAGNPSADKRIKLSTGVGSVSISFGD